VGVPEDVERARHQSWAGQVSFSVQPINHIAEVIKGVSRGKRVGMVGYQIMPFRFLEEIRRLLGARKWVDFETALSSLRMVKSEWELSRIKRAAEIADLGFKTFLQSIKVGVAEYEVVAEVEHVVKKAGAEDNFMLISSGGPEERGMHPPTSRRFQRGDILRVEITPQFDGYWVQLCRTAVIGEAKAAYKEAFEIFRRAETAGLQVLKAGVTASEVAKAQNDIFRDAGYGDFVSRRYTRGRGHGQGLHLDEPPLLAEGNSTEIKANMVCPWEDTWSSETQWL